MALRKYASLEQAQVLDLKGSENQSRTASLDKLGEFRDYRTEDGYLYARIRAISLRINKNHDGWPSIELAGGEDNFNRYARQAKEAGFTVMAGEEKSEYGFSTFLGKPIFVDHNNSNPDRARGVIVDAKLHVENHKTASELDPYYALAPDNHMPPTWVELLLEVDAKNFPRLAKAIIDGSKDAKRGIDGFSMGANVEKSVCSICKNAATSPDDYCKHVKLKGAEFDWVNPKTGHKESKRAYEDCYGVQFFEISAVFDPADETALIREVRSLINKEAGIMEVACPNCGYEHAQFSELDHMGHCPHCGQNFNNPVAQTNQTTSVPGGRPGPYPANPTQQMGTFARQANIHLAEHPLPQNEMEGAPEYVDTLREEEICPVCGSSMDQGHSCDVCGFVEPPEGLGNPDLQKAQETNALQDPQDLGTPAENVDVQNHPSVPNSSQPIPNPQTPPTANPQVAASVKNEEVISIYHPYLLGKINPRERPILSNPRPATNEPKEIIVSDQFKPVTNRTAASMIAAVNQGERMSNATVAAEAPAGTSADKRVDVVGVGGVMDSSNESASQADLQSEVEGKGGYIQDSNEEASAAGSQETLTGGKPNSDDAGFNKDKTTEDSGPTKTFDNSNESDSAVTGDAFPASEDGVKKSTWKIVATDDGVYPEEDGGLAGGTANPGTQPSDPVGKADKRVNVLEHVTSPSNNSGPTTTWSGTDGNGVTKQQPAVTNETLEGSDIVNLKKGYVNVVDILKVADAEVELGIIPAEDKYERIAELENESAEVVQATAAVLARVKTAGLKKNASVKRGGVGRVPSFRSAGTVLTIEADESLFL